MRVLNQSFMADLQQGFLSPLREAIANDRDLLLEIRNDYINVYFKGQSLLKLSQNSNSYSVELHPKFVPSGVVMADHLRTKQDAQAFVGEMPHIKERIVVHRAGKGGNEIEFEQMLIRANNNEPRLNSEYYFIDRQIVVPEGRFDLFGIYWARAGRRRHQTVPLALHELKYGGNPEIAAIHTQLELYYNSLTAERLDDIANEAKALLRQKIQLGLLYQPQDRLEALKTLEISPLKADIRIGVVLVDYNPHAQLLNTAALKALPFANRIDLFYVGFGLWHSRAVTL